MVLGEHIKRAGFVGMHLNGIIRRAMADLDGSTAAVDALGDTTAAPGAQGFLGRLRAVCEVG